MTTQVSVPLSLREIDPGDRARGDVPPATPATPAPQPAQPTRNEDGTPNDRGWLAIGKALRMEMPTKERPGRGTAKFKYITARQVAERLDAVVGPGRWQTCFRVLDADKVIVECTLTLFSVSKVDVGYSNNPDAEHESEPFKAAYSDAFKRAAVQWGIGRWIYGDT